MAVYFAYITEKVTQDDVAGATASARAKASTKLGTDSIELYERVWTPNWICTTWRRCIPDIPPNP